MIKDARNEALELVEEGLVSADDMLVMALKYMSQDDVADMLDANELSESFNEEEDDADSGFIADALDHHQIMKKGIVR